MGGSLAMSIRDWACGYLDEPIVRDFSFDLQVGQIACIVGSNGAGKSTLLRSVFGMIKRFSGELRFFDRRIETMTTPARMALGMSFVPQGRCNFPYLTVQENMELATYTLPKPAAKQAMEAQAAKFEILGRKWKERASNLSGGEQQIVEMAMALAVEPRLLLIDEPSLGLSPKMRIEVFETIRSLVADGVSVIMVEQNVRGGLGIADVAVVMDLGMKVMQGPAAEILEDPRISSVFLGGTPQEQVL